MEYENKHSLLDEIHNISDVVIKMCMYHQEYINRVEGATPVWSINECVKYDIAMISGLI